MEQELVTKVEELMLSLDSAREYKEITKAMFDSSLIVSSILLTILSFTLIFNTCEIFGYINTQVIIPFPYVMTIVFYLLLLIIPLGVFIGRRRALRKRTEKWREVLKEGAPAAIKLLAELDWKSIFEDIRLMKYAIVIRLVGGVFLYYLFIQMLGLFVGLAILNIYINVLFAYLDLYYLAMYILPIPIAIFFSRSDFKNYYQKLGSVDYLLWNLRWLYSEFKGMRFEA